MDLEFVAAVWALTAVLIVLNIIANWHELVDGCRSLLGRQKPVRIRIRQVERRPLDPETEQRLRAALDEIGGTRLVAPPATKYEVH